MSETWYRTGRWRSLIEPVEVVKENKKSVWIREDRWKLDGECAEPAVVMQAKASQYWRFFKSWEEAHAHLVERAEQAVADARLRLNDATGRLGNIKGLKKP